MIQKQSQQSLLDLLLRIMPDLKDRMGPGGFGMGRTNTRAANTLYSIWSNEASKVATNKFRRPENIQYADAKLLESEGLVTCSGDELVITAKGGDIIKQMILGDSASAFDEERPVDYLTALSNLNPVRSQRKKAKVASSHFKTIGRNWYTELVDGN